MFARLPTCCKLGQQVRNMNTAIGIEKFMDLAGDLAGGIAGLRDSSERNTIRGCVQSVVSEIHHQILAGFERCWNQQCLAST